MRVRLLTEGVLARRLLPFPPPHPLGAGGHELHARSAAVRHGLVEEVGEHAPAVALLHGGSVPSLGRCAVAFGSVARDGGAV